MNMFGTHQSDLSLGYYKGGHTPRQLHTNMVVMEGLIEAYRLQP
jgi:hypothetical protein